MPRAHSSPPVRDAHHRLSRFILSYDPSGSVMSDDHYQFFPHRYDYIDKATETSNGISHYEFD